MRDELRRLDHLTRNQRALITEDTSGALALDDENLKWINPQKPLPLDATIATEEGGAEFRSSISSRSRVIRSKTSSYATRSFVPVPIFAARERFVS